MEVRRDGTEKFLIHQNPRRRDTPVVRERRPNIMVNMTANRRHKGGKKKKTR